MRAEQEIIADWMNRIMERNCWTAQDWADLAGVAPTSITRALRPEFQSVTTIPTLDRLARAAGVGSVLEFLSHQ